MRSLARFSCLLVVLGTCGAVFSVGSTFVATVIPAFASSEGKLEKSWREFSFAKIKTHTRYEIVNDGERKNVLHAKADQAASGLRFDFDQPLALAPILRWNWKIGSVPKGSDAAHKSTDDYAARIYVTFVYEPEKASIGMRAEYGFAKTLFGEYPPHSAISYIVEPNLPIGTIVDNPYTSRVKMIVVDNGATLNTWRQFERNVAADYEKAFHEPPPNVSSIVVMTDSDNTMSSAEAWYGSISLRK